MEGDVLKATFHNKKTNGAGLIEFTFHENGFNAKWKQGLEPGLMRGKWEGLITSNIKNNQTADDKLEITVDNGVLLIKRKIKGYLKEFPLIIKESLNIIKFEPITINSLGEANNFPDPNTFNIDRRIYSRHSSVFEQLKHDKLHHFFNEFENSKGNFIYIFWANYSSISVKNDSFDITKNIPFEKSPTVNKRNLDERTKSDSLLVPIYVGKSEGKLNGRIICHVDGTLGQYSALKIRERFNGAEIFLSLIPVSFDQVNEEDRNFLSKVMCFSLEYFMATKLKPIIGIHK